jgi:anti-anti-sigma factor
MRAVAWKATEQLAAFFGPVASAKGRRLEATASEPIASGQREDAMSPSNDFVVEEVQGAIVITLIPQVGALESANFAQRRGALLDAIRNTTASAVIIDFAHTGYFGSLLLDTLGALWKHVRERSGTMALCNLSEVSKEILTTSKLDSIWPIYSSRRAAIEAQQRRP